MRLDGFLRDIDLAGDLRVAVAIPRLGRTTTRRCRWTSSALDAAEYANLELIRKAGTAAAALSAFDTDKNQSLDFKEYVGLVTALVNAKH